MSSSCADGELGRRILDTATELAFPRYPGCGRCAVIAILEQRLARAGPRNGGRALFVRHPPRAVGARSTLAAGALLVAAAGWVMARSALAGLVLLGLALLPG